VLEAWLRVRVFRGVIVVAEAGVELDHVTERIV